MKKCPVTSGRVFYPFLLRERQYLRRKATYRITIECVIASLPRGKPKLNTIAMQFHRAFRLVPPMHALFRRRLLPLEKQGFSGCQRGLISAILEMGDRCGGGAAIILTRRPPFRHRHYIAPAANTNVTGTRIIANRSASRTNGVFAV